MFPRLTQTPCVCEGMPLTFYHLGGQGGIKVTFQTRLEAEISVVGDLKAGIYVWLSDGHLVAMIALSGF